MIASISLPPASLLNPNFCSPSLQTDLLAFDWRDLIALGVTQAEAHSIATRLIARRLMLAYWRKLLKAGVALHTARRLARTIAKYDVMARLPTPQQQHLLRQHCPAICRSGLWRVEMLLQARN
jgi:hypothetical protein